MTQSGDAESLFRQAEALRARAAELEAEALQRTGESADADSLAALHRIVGRAVAESNYPQAQHLLSSVPSDYRDVLPEQWVSVAPGVLGPGVSLDGDDELMSRAPARSRSSRRTSSAPSPRSNASLIG